MSHFNKHIKYFESFLYGSRISNDHIYIILASVAQATMLVEQVGIIKVNNKERTIKVLRS